MAVFDSSSSHFYDLDAVLLSLCLCGNKIRLWNKGVDSESFYPKYRAQEMRIRLSNREPKRPLIVHVGRLGVEKSLDLLKSVMDQIWEARIAFIGDGPYSISLRTYWLFSFVNIAEQSL
ncbi:Sulfoquinovosyl transferase SQD2 [Camellia lanceoleosa]|uniref:Sulfoquinovosyl transferase SQD2 n=1 Tax=Camellia lanceoleosa TaxID=1840588 RepID=A0ACC0HB04_9ERIC|nr:Sulfoquinovosyl transferase SQD2 [Camellia lanceoleosa]